MNSILQENAGGNIDRISICAKVEREFEVEVLDNNFDVIKIFEDSVPEIFSETCGGRYFSVQIDYQTGKIVDWGKIKKNLAGQL